MFLYWFFFFSSRRRHTRFDCDWSSDVCSSDLERHAVIDLALTRAKAQAQAALEIVETAVEIAERPRGIGQHAAAAEILDALPVSGDLGGDRLLQPRVEVHERLYDGELLPHHQLGRSGWRRRAQVSHEVGDGEVRLVPDRRNHRHAAGHDGARDALVVEG